MFDLIRKVLLLFVDPGFFVRSENFLFSDNQISTYDILPKTMFRNNTKFLTFSTFTRDESVNLTKITWAHAVNSQALLNEALNSPIDMIEADIVLGTINNSGPSLPVMAHPPATNSDISLEEFLNQIMKFNTMHANEIKGIKLDFKSIEVFEGSLHTLNEKVPLMSCPIWLNADIIRGPVNETTTVPVDPERFFAGCRPFDKAVLSIGWTTKWGANYVEGSYTRKQIDEMILAIKKNNVTGTGQAITFPVRAGIAANSEEQLHELVKAVNETNECSLTIWSSQNDFVDVEKLRKLIFSFGFDRIYIDLPDEVANKLDLGSVKNRSRQSLPTFISFGIISCCMIFASLWLQRVQT